MTKTRLVNIGSLYGITTSNAVKLGGSLAKVDCLTEAYLEFEDGKISGFGPMTDKPNTVCKEHDIEGGIVYPSYVDCHTHLVFAANREDEFVDRIKGLSYQEIANRGGGILNSANKLGSMSEDQLFDEALERLHQLIKMGTGAIEIKSGYGLSLDAELKMLRVIKRIKAVSPIPVKSTFLGAHAYPLEYQDRKNEYIDHIISDMLPAIAESGLADYIDAFCEEGYFSTEETERIVQAAAEHGLPARLHVNQFTSTGGVEMSARNNVISVEHLEVMTEEDIEVLARSNMFGVALPACSFFLQIPYTPARKLIEANVPFVLASDFNPGSSPTGNLSFVMSLACIYMKLLPEEALNALTINAANALGLADEVGSIAVGKRANVVVSKQAKSLNSIPYRFGDDLIDRVYVNGVVA
ncbi:MAG: imidazolonepropionase [Bacteroidia bacterium]|nr:imidazolonepropionase [Bacteroidia bacterium]